MKQRHWIGERRRRTDRGWYVGLHMTLAAMFWGWGVYGVSIHDAQTALACSLAGWLSVGCAVREWKGR